MAEYLFIVGAIMAGFYALTYARWLKHNGNKTGAIGVFVLVMMSVALTAYQLFAAP